MDRIAIYKSCADVTFAEVATEIKMRYADLNIQTGAKQFLDLMLVVINHKVMQSVAKKMAAKYSLASLISDAFTVQRRN